MNANSGQEPHSTQKNGRSAGTAIVTDSIAQVPRELARPLKIHVVPFSVAFEGKVYTDLLDLDLGGLYQRMRFEKDLRLLTSAPSIGQYYEAFKACFDSGCESVVYIGISSRLSRAYESAVQAAKMIHEDLGPLPITLYDSRLATSALGFLAIDAARLAHRGEGPQAILNQIKAERKRTGFAAGLETLEYLNRGGRIGKAAYLLGSAIHILPVISLDDNGEVVAIGKKRGYDRILLEIIRYVKSKVDRYSYLSLAVMHADARFHAEKLRSMAVQQFHPNEIYITDFTPTMVAHTGPGIIGLAYHWHP